MKRIIKLSIFFIYAVVFTGTFAQDVIDEDMLFADTNSMIDSSEVIDSSITMGNSEKTTAAFSGSVNSVAQFGLSREFLKNLNRHEITPSAYILGNLLLDIRLPKDIKAFANLETTFNADSSDFDVGLQELFIDANVKRKIYFRTGKQVLQWGRCYFWNPTDLINVEKKKLEPDIGYREGAYGIKAHVPFGTKYNLYGFIDMRKMTSVDSVAGAIKGEILLGVTEIGTALWGKKSRKPVFGIDFSTMLADLTISGELSLESGRNYTKIDSLRPGEPMYEFLLRAANNPDIDLNATIDKKVIAKTCVGISKSFDLMDIKNRVNVISEFFYNQGGVPGDFYDEHDIKETFDTLDAWSRDTNNSNSDGVNEKKKKLQNRFSNPNEFSRYYMSLFLTISKFIVPEMQFQFNTIINFEQHAAMIIGSLQYTTLHNLTLGFVITGAVGSGETEYTLSNSALSARLNLGIAF